MNGSTFTEQAPNDPTTTTMTTLTRARPPRRTLGKGSVHVDTSVESANPGLTTVTEQQRSNALRPNRLAASAARARNRVAFSRLELREGVVLSVAEDSFRARLADPEDAAPDEELDIDLAQVSRSDLALLKPGALFFWAVGYLTRSTGRRELVLKVEFRRLAKAVPGAPERAREAAQAFLKDAGWI